MARKTAAEVWRDYITDGVPLSGVRNPPKADIREYEVTNEATTGLGLTSVSGTNAITASSGHDLTELWTGLTVWFTAGAANTSAVTLNLDELGSVSVRLRVGSTLGPDSWLAGDVVQLKYDGTFWRLTSGAGTGSVSAPLAVKYEAQALTEGQGRIARQNIRAAQQYFGNHIRDFVLADDWLTSEPPAVQSFFSVCWSPELGLFAAIAQSGTGNRVMTSPDGIEWESQTSAADLSWRSVCWSPELALFVAVAQTGTGNRVMTSPDGEAWTSRTSAADIEWNEVIWSPELELFVAVGDDGQVMKSTDGETWVLVDLSPGNTADWQSVCWAPELGLLVAVSNQGTGDRVMTSPDGTTWTRRTTPADNDWISVCWAPELGLFVAVAITGTGDRIMTSPNGITWSGQTNPVDDNWSAVAYAAELRCFVAVASGGSAGGRLMYSVDGITWTQGEAATPSLTWRGICWSPGRGLFVAVASSGTGDRVMTSVSANFQFPYRG